MAARVLDSIPTTSALELMTSVLSKTNPPGSTFHSALDDILTQQKLIASPLSRGDLIELHSAAAVGKTQLLYFFCMTTLLPTELVISMTDRVESVYIGGHGKSVVVCDCDGRWDVSRLASMMEKHLSKRVAASSIPSAYVPPDAVSEATQASLRRLHVFQPISTLSLATTLQALSTYQKNRMKDEEIAMLMIDSITAFYWSDRWDMERDRVPIERHPMKHVAAALTMVRRKYGPVTFMTTQEFFPAAPSSSQRTYLPTPTYHITLTQPAVPPYPPMTTLAEAASEPERKQAVKDAIVEGRVKDKGIFDFGIEDWGLVVE